MPFVRLLAIRLACAAFVGYAVHTFLFRESLHSNGMHSIPYGAERAWPLLLFFRNLMGALLILIGTSLRSGLRRSLPLLKLRTPLDRLDVVAPVRLSGVPCLI